MEEPKFLSDCMLGKLARWLAILGYDSHFVKHSERSDLDIAEEALREGRVLLTRDTRIPPVKGLLVMVLREQTFEDQLKRVLGEFKLTPDRDRLFSRCTECGQPLDPVAREQALEELPPKVKTLDTPFFRCPECRQLYWHGTHVSNTIEKLEKMGLSVRRTP